MNNIQASVKLAVWQLVFGCHDQKSEGCGLKHFLQASDRRNTSNGDAVELVY